MEGPYFYFACGWGKFWEKEVFVMRGESDGATRKSDYGAML